MRGLLRLGVMLAIAVLAGCGGPTPAQSTESPGAPRDQTAKHAPDVQLVAYQGSELLGGEEVWLSSLFSREAGEGRPIVLNFWAGQCPPCRAEIPDLQEVHEEYGDDLLLFGLDVGPFVGLGSREAGKELLRELGVTYAAGTTFDREVVREYRLVGMPSTYFIKPDGEIHRTWAGLLTRDKLRELTKNLLDASSS